MKVLVCFLLLTLCATSVMSACFFGEAKEWITEYGKKYYYCEYEGIEFLAPAKFRTKDCMKCICKKTGLECCGFGPKAGIMSVPEDSKCKPVANGCKVRWVKRSNGEWCPKRLRGE